MEKKVYKFEPETKIYVGYEYAQESPRQPGVFLIPPDTTEIVPPEPKDGCKIIFNTIDNEWIYAEFTIDDYKDLERQWVRDQIIRYSQCLNNVDLTVYKYFKLKRYIKKLQKWPESKKFPNKEYRPKAPFKG